MSDQYTTSNLTPNAAQTAPRADMAPAPADGLRLLGGLTGTWVGTGLNVISLPDFDSRHPSTGPRRSRLLLNATIETLEFTPIGGDVANRGSLSAPGASTGQTDIDLTGLRYLQRVSDFVTNEALHIEPGFWLNVPPTVQPVQPAFTIARLGTIPHGDSLMAQGVSFSLNGGPAIADVSTLPSGDIQPGDREQFLDPPLPANFKLAFVQNPNLALREAIDGQTITNTTVLRVSTGALKFTIPVNANPTDPNPPGTVVDIPSAGPGIVNLPFVVANADAVSMDATFWIETVVRPDGRTIMQLQYTQTVVLRFLGVNWPHVSVATLVRQ